MKWTEVVQDCSQAVELNPRYVKALFRRAKALEKLDNKKECLEGETLLIILKSVTENVSLSDTHVLFVHLSSRCHSSVYSWGFPEPTEHVVGRQSAEAAGEREGQREI